MNKIASHYSITDFITPGGDWSIQPTQIDFLLEQKLRAIKIKDTTDVMMKVYQAFGEKTKGAKPLTLNSSIKVFYNSIKAFDGEALENYLESLIGEQIDSYKEIPPKAPAKQQVSQDHIQTDKTMGTNGPGVLLAAKVLQALLSKNKIDEPTYFKLLNALSKDAYDLAEISTPRGYLARSQVLDVVKRVLHEGGLLNVGVNPESIINQFWDEYKQLESTGATISALIKMANALDEKGFFVQAEVIDVIINKLVS